MHKAEAEVIHLQNPHGKKTGLWFYNYINETGFLEQILKPKRRIAKKIVGRLVYPPLPRNLQHHHPTGFKDTTGFVEHGLWLAQMFHHRERNYCVGYFTYNR